jgi:hypothetical protein
MYMYKYSSVCLYKYIYIGDSNNGGINQDENPSPTRETGYSPQQTTDENIENSDKNTPNKSLGLNFLRGIYICVYMHICINISIYVFTFIYMYVYIYTYVYTYMFTHTLLKPPRNCAQAVDAKIFE